ncbi:MAG: sulfite exporter TauE/SafE family protein [Polyangiaceae bacterium]
MAVRPQILDRDRDMNLTVFGELLGFGVVAGALTTVAGMGGGLFLVLTLSLTHGPLAALGITSPALFLSNAQRAFMFRRVIEGRAVARFALGAVPAAIGGALVAAKLPPLAVRRHARPRGLRGAPVARRRSLRARPARLRPALGHGRRVLSAGAGAAGFLAGPLFMALGLSGATYVGTVALGAVVLHAARLVGYGAGGVLKPEYAPLSIALFVGLVLGNLAGKHLRAHLTPRSEARIELGALALAAVLGLLGIR